MNLNRVEALLGGYYVVGGFEAAFWTVETYIVEFLVVSESEFFLAASWATRLCPLG